LHMIVLAADLSPVLSFLDALGKAITPAGQLLLETRPESLTLICHLLAEVANQATLTALVALELLPTLFTISSQALDRRQTLIVEKLAQVLGVVFVEVIDNLEGEILLAIEVVIKGSLGHPGGFEHLLDARVVVALFQHDLRARFKKRALCDFLCAGLSGHL